MTMLYIALAWSIFYALHSFLASRSLKAWVEEHAASLHRFYRLFYSFISSCSLFALLFLHKVLPQQLLWQHRSFSLSLLAFVLLFFGSSIVLYALLRFDIFVFLGFRQLQKQSKELYREGLYAWVRHPLYSGLCLIALAALLFFPYSSTLAALFVLALYLPLGIYLEEQKLIEEFGEQYKNYQREVKAVIPYMC